jgi:HD-GYP domain-containing protein (c-di-GMP phosphodiesterase class II)
MTTADRSDVRLAELVATISLGTDLGLGQPMEHVIRQTIIALRIGDLLDLAESERTVLYYSGLLAWVGCHTDAYEQAKWFGDDIGFKQAMFQVETPTAFARYLVGNVGAGRPALDRVRTGAAFPFTGARWLGDILESHWRTTDLLAERLGLGLDVRQSLRESYERWDGRGPGGMTGEDIRLTSRIVYLADVAAVFQRTGGPIEAVAVVRERAGSAFDPALADLFCTHADDLLTGLDEASHWPAIIDAEPGLAVVVDEGRLDGALAAIGDFADLKSPYYIGHSGAVAGLAADAATTLGLPAATVTAVRRAGLVHDFGRLGVSNAIWDKPGPLSGSEAERLRMHPYLTERMLAFTPSLAELGVIAAQHHERLDGSGYPRGLKGSAVGMPGRILGAADRFTSLVSERPHRPARSTDEAVTALREDVRAGRLDGDAVEAVVAASGSRRTRKRTWPAGLTAREVEVLRLLCLGLSNREIADRLTIARKTAGAHIEHIYAKTGATNRATAALFAMQHDLIEPARSAPKDRASTR